MIHTQGLIPGQIPAEEPLLQVGIVLAEDKQESCSISFSNPQKTGFIFDGEKQNFIIDKCTLNVNKSVLEFQSSDFNAKAKKITILMEGEKEYARLSPVIAGRGFHWSKHIEVNLPHSLTLFAEKGALKIVNDLPLEIYLACVATSEMSANCPEAFLQAQSIAARSWMLANVEQKHRHQGFDVCNDDCCQRYQGINNLTEQSQNAVEQTFGKVLFYNNTICDARYSKSCGGQSEAFENLWENTPKSYLIAVADTENEALRDLSRESELREFILSPVKSFCSTTTVPEKDLKKYLGRVDEDGQYFRWEKTISNEELAKNIQKVCHIDCRTVIELIPKSRTRSGRMLELEIYYLDELNEKKHILIEKDYAIRKALHPDFLYSSLCLITGNDKNSKDIPETFTYEGAGWGHGAGMCQIGALSMALQKYSPEDILRHYYPGTTLKTLYSKGR